MDPAVHNEGAVGVAPRFLLVVLLRRTIKWKNFTEVRSTLLIVLRPQPHLSAECWLTTRTRLSAGHDELKSPGITRFRNPFRS